jgi:hypothetical protein
MHMEYIFMVAQKPFRAQVVRAGDFVDHNPS